MDLLVFNMISRSLDNDLPSFACVALQVEISPVRE